MQVLIDTQHYVPESSLRGVSREEQMSIIIRLPRSLNVRATEVLRPQRLTMSEYLRHALVALTLSATPSPAAKRDERQMTIDEQLDAVVDELADAPPGKRKGARARAAALIRERNARLKPPRKAKPRKRGRK